MTEPEEIVQGIRDQMRNISPSDVGKLDQLKASCADRAREVLTYYLLAGLHDEKGQTELQEDAAIRMALVFKDLEFYDTVGVALVLAEIVTDFLLAQGDGTYAAAVARVIDPDLPLVAGRPNLTDDPLWRLEREQR
jgi:hypothetical protein